MEKGAMGRTAGGKLTEWKGLKGRKAGVRREEGRRATEREAAEE